MALIVTDDKNYYDIADRIREGLDRDIEMKPAEMSSYLEEIKARYIYCVDLTESCYMPGGAERIRDDCFYNQAYLRAISIASTVKTLGPRCFEKCVKLRTIVIPDNIKTFSGNNHFKDCSLLTRAFFKGRPNAIPATLFTNCDLLKHIYVSWDQDEIAGAPWGAVNATIHYGIKFDTDICTFSVGENQYQAKYGMTWREFIDSVYNPIDTDKTNDKYFIGSDTNTLLCLDPTLSEPAYRKVIYNSYTKSTYLDEAIIPLQQYGFASL